MKHIFYIILLVSSFNGVAQEYADKEYYLVDSLILSELSEGDRGMLETALKKYHAAKNDTSKINSLVDICENMMHDSWMKYQELQLQTIKTSFKVNKSDVSELFLLKHLASGLNNLAYVNLMQGNNKRAILYYDKAKNIALITNDANSLATYYLGMGFLYNNQGEIEKALGSYHYALKHSESINDQDGVANAYQNIAGIYEYQGEIEKGLIYSTKSLKVYKLLGDKRGMGYALNSIGAFYYKKKDYSRALENYMQALVIRKKIGDQRGVTDSYNNIGLFYSTQNQPEKALEYFTLSLQLQEKMNYFDRTSTIFNIAQLYFRSGEFQKAKEMAIHGLELSQEFNFPSEIMHVSNLLSKIYEHEGNGIKALEMYKLHVQMKDSINNETTQKATAQQEAKYEYEKQKTIDDAEHDKLLAIEQEEKEKQQILTGATAGGLGLVVVFLFFVFNRLRVTKKQKGMIEEQKQEVEKQKEVVEQAHDELEEKNQEILDSIIYAKRIQSAILPPDKLVKEYLKESFILYKPKDVVAGDFYWLEHKDDKVLFAAADCTGHGVPGAMVSVVCNNALNRSVREHRLIDPGEILTKTREIVIQEFEKSEEEVKDGMDIALCSLEGMKLQYAGAHNPLWIIRKGEIIETKANKQPIGQFDNPEPCTTHGFDLEKGDSIYVFSDGYVDQFGGEKGKKFKTKAFRELLLSIQDKTMEEQKTIIDNSFETWKGALEQIDDVCLIGVRV